MRRPASSPAAEGWRPTTRTAAIGLAGLALLILIIGLFHHWSQGQISSRGEVQRAVSQLEPACRPILEERFKEKLVKDGKPLTRGEVRELTSGIEDCEKINQQMSALRQE